MSRERWQGIQDPEARFLHSGLYARLERQFDTAIEPLAVAYDGILWAVQAGVVSSPRNPSLDLLPVTLRRGIHVPGLFQVGVLLPGIHESFYEYSEHGGFNLDRKGTPGSEVYKGQYVSMHDMVTHLVPDSELTVMAATTITREWLSENPHDMPPIEALGYMPTTPEPTQQVA